MINRITSMMILSVLLVPPSDKVKQCPNYVVNIYQNFVRVSRKKGLFQGNERMGKG